MNVKPLIRLVRILINKLARQPHLKPINLSIVRCQTSSICRCSCIQLQKCHSFAAARAASKLTLGNFSLINKLATSSIWRPDRSWQAPLFKELFWTTGHAQNPASLERQLVAVCATIADIIEIM